MTNHPAPDGNAGRPAEGMTVLGVMNVLLQYRRVIILVPLALMIITFAAVRLGKRDFVATATMTANSAQAPSRVSGIAAQFGVALPSGAAGESPEFFRALLVSREILRQAALTTYSIRTGPLPADSVTGTYIQIAEIEGDTETGKTIAAIKDLEARIRSSTDIATNILTLTVRAPHADLAVQLNRRILELADEYNSARRRSQARMEREFVQERTAEAKRSLEEAEGALRAFLENNRGYAGSPQLMFDHQSLQRRVELAQQLYVSLAQGYEQARIDEVRNMPVLSVITPPETVVEPVRGGLIARLLLAFVAGLFFAVIYAFVRTSVDRHRIAGSSDYQTFVRLAGATVRNPLNVFRGRSDIQPLPPT